MPARAGLGASQQPLARRLHLAQGILTGRRQRDRLAELTRFPHEVIGLDQFPRLEIVVPANQEILGVVIEGNRSVPEGCGAGLAETDDVQQGCVATMQANAHDDVLGDLREWERVREDLRCLRQ